MDLELSKHAKRVVAKRNLRIEWIEAVLAHPECIEDDSLDETLVHYLASVEEYGNRVLRVIVNEKVTPRRVITTYFDRGMRGRI